MTRHLFAAGHGQQRRIDTFPAATPIEHDVAPTATDQEGRSVSGHTPSRVQPSIPTRDDGPDSGPSGPPDPFVGLNSEPVRSEPDTVTVEVEPTKYIIRTRDRTRVYPRVTTVLGVLNKHGLVPWAAKAVAEYAILNFDEWRDLANQTYLEAKATGATEQKAKDAAESLAIRRLKAQPDTVRDRASERGKAVHQAIECWAARAPLPALTDDEAACYWQARRFIRDHNVLVQHVELTLFSDEHQYAGTGDFFLAEMPEGSGRFWILDWKTSRNIWPEHGLQLAAYLGADHMILDGQIIRRGLFTNWPTHAGIVHLRPESYTLYELVGAKAKHEEFLAARHIYRAQQQRNSNGLRMVESSLVPALKASLVLVGQERPGTNGTDRPGT